MFWDDIAEMKEDVFILKNTMHRIECILNRKPQDPNERNEIEQAIANELEDIKESIQDSFCSDDESSSINRIHNKLDILLRDSDRQKAVILAEMTLDKFEDYMKNVDKLNGMINEFKGCVSMARGALSSSNEPQAPKRRNPSWGWKYVNDIAKGVNREDPWASERADMEHFRRMFQDLLIVIENNLSENANFSNLDAHWVIRISTDWIVPHD